MRSQTFVILSIPTLLVVWLSELHAAPGSVDLSFDAGSGLNLRVNALALQPHGRILIGGLFTTVNGSNRNYVARFNGDGTLDSSFDPGVGENGPVLSMATQS